MRAFALCVSTALLVLLASTVSSSAAEPAAAAAESAPKQGPALFAAAKLAALEGLWEEALPLFEDAVAADGADLYLRLEFAHALLGAASGAETPTARAALLARAGEQAEAAARLSPGGLEALRLLAQVRLTAAQADPAARPLALQALAALHAASPNSSAVLAYARLLVEEGRAADAVAVLRETLRRYEREGSADPRQERAVATLLVEMLRQPGAEASAPSLEILRDVVAADPNLLEARLALAEAELQRGEASGALAILEEAPLVQRGLPELRVQLALARLRAGQFETALEALDDASLTARQSALLRTTILDAEGRFAEAAATVGPWVSANPEDIEAAAIQARLLYRLGRGAEAQALFASLAENSTAADAGRAAWLRLRAGLLAAAFEDWAAVERATRALLAVAEPAVRLEGVVLRAEALVETSRAQEAWKLLASEGDEAIVEAKRAEVLAALGRSKEAVKRLSKLGERGEESALVAIAAFQRMDRHREALRLAESLVRKNPESIAGRFRLASSLERLGRRQEAEAAFRTLLEREPGFAPALNYLGYMLAERGEKPAEALSLTRRAVALEPASGAYADSLGWASYRTGDLASARRQLERASRLEPDATVFEHLGDVLAALGEVAAARAAYGRAEDLGPERPRELRRKIESLDSATSQQR